MPERKNFKILTTLEQTLYALVVLVARERSLSLSAYVRSCILEDLESKGLLTKEVAKRLLI